MELKRVFVRVGVATAIAAAIALTGCSGSMRSTPSPALPQDSVPASNPYFVTTESNVVASCAVPINPGDVVCLSLQRTDVGDAAPYYFPGRRVEMATVAGYGPADLQSAYNLPSSTNGSTQTVAVVSAYDDPNAEADLGVYRTQYGLPPCTTANGCFKKLNESGVVGSYPTPNAAWGQETSLDLDMVSAICPLCKIILVEAKTAQLSDLGASVKTAVGKGANVISNSYAATESGSSNSLYSYSGHVLVAGAGDSGTGPAQPATYSTVVAVGGTTLTRDSSARGWSETVWSRSGSGCSAKVSKPSWQTEWTTLKTRCTMRSDADVAAVADPNTGVAVYDSYGSSGQVGWLVFGGTSVSTPIISGTFALAGNAATQNAAQGIWKDAGAHLNHVGTGSNGTCTVSYICNATASYSGPTGWGTPNGVGAF